MANNLSQIVASTFNTVQKDRGKAANQWSESAFLNYLKKKDGIKEVPGGPQLELTLDFQANTGADFLATDSTTTGTSKTTVLDAATYDWGKLVIPINWTFSDEFLNADANRKVDLVASIVDNAKATHDQTIETGFFAATATDGFESLNTMLTEDGTGTFGNIVSGTETWWKNQFKDYTDGSTLLADMRTLYNSCSKGTGGSEPNVIATSSTQYGLYESKLTPNQRFEDPNVAVGGFRALKFANADVVYSSAYSGDSFYFINTRFSKLYVVRGAYAQAREAIEHINAAMMNMKIFSLVQFATNNRSRIGVLFT
jgi:hypothetical protein